MTNDKLLNSFSDSFFRHLFTRNHFGYEQRSTQKNEDIWSEPVNMNAINDDHKNNQWVSP